MTSPCLEIIVVSYVNKILVSKETVVLRRWEIETEIDFIKRVDNGKNSSEAIATVCM